MQWQEPKTDRTATATLNVDDFNRIENNILIIATKLNLNLTVKINWTIYDFPKLSEFNRICNNLESLENAYLVPPKTPNIPLAPFLEYKKINALETITKNLYECWLKNNAEKNYAAETYCGKKIGVL